MRSALLALAIFLGVFTLGLGIRHVSRSRQAPSSVVHTPQSSSSGSIVPAIAGPGANPSRPSLLRTAKGAELFEALFPVSQWSHWDEDETVFEARARFAESYPPAGDAHESGPREKEIMARMGILKAMGERFRGPAAQAFYREVVRSEEHLMVRRQALENLRPVMAGIPERDREEILANLPPRLVALAAYTGEEILEKVWAMPPDRSVAEAAEAASLNKWENLPCPSSERFFELARPLGWEGKDPYVCDLSPLGKLGRVLELLSTLELPAENLGELGENIRHPYEFLDVRSDGLSFNLDLVHEVAVNFPFMRSIQLGGAFFSNDPLDSLGVLIHEARHSDKEDRGHEVCLQGDIPRMRGGCDAELSYAPDAGAYSYGLFFSMALARSRYVSPSDREWLETDSLLLVSRRFNRLTNELAYFEDAIAGLTPEGRPVVLHPFAQAALSPPGLPEKERFHSLAYDDSKGGIYLFGSRIISWRYGYWPAEVLSGEAISGKARLIRKIRLPGEDTYAYNALVSDDSAYIVEKNSNTGDSEAKPFLPGFAVKDLFLGDLLYSYFLSKDGGLFRLRAAADGLGLAPMHEGKKFRQATGGVLRETVFVVSEDGHLFHHEFRGYPIAINSEDSRTAHPVDFPPGSVLVEAEFQSPVPARQYEEGTSLRALLGEDGNIALGYHGEGAPRVRLSGMNLKSIAIMKLLATRGALAVEKPKRDLERFRHACGVSRAELDPWFRRGVGISRGTLFFEGDKGECLPAALPEGLQGRIAAFSFAPGSFSGNYGEETYHFAPAGLELKLTDGAVRTVRPYEGWK